MDITNFFKLYEQVFCDLYIRFELYPLTSIQKDTKRIIYDKYGVLGNFIF